MTGWACGFDGGVHSELGAGTYSKPDI